MIRQKTLRLIEECGCLQKTQKIQLFVFFVRDD